MPLQQHIQQLLQNPDQAVDPQWLADVAEKYPCFTLPTLLYLKRGGNDPEHARLAELATAIPDRQALALQLAPTLQHFIGFYPPEPEPETPDTDTTIDRFLNSFGHTSDKEVEALMGAIFNPQPDYADILAAEERNSGGPNLDPHDEQDRLINEFIAENTKREQQTAPTTTHINEQEADEIADTPVDQPQSADETMFTESLAKTYIARQKFAQALEIIQNISAHNPKKSIYFADQIRFLKKLIYVQQHENN